MCGCVRVGAWVCVCVSLCLSCLGVCSFVCLCVLVCAYLCLCVCMLVCVSVSMCVCPLMRPGAPTPTPTPTLPTMKGQRCPCQCLATGIVEGARGGDFSKGQYYRGLNGFLYYFGGSLLQFLYNGPKNPIRIIKAPIVCCRVLSGAYRVQPSRG